MDLVARLFGEAWDHRRQRHRAVIVSLGIAAVVTAIVAGLLTSGQNSQSANTVVRNESSLRLVAQTYTILTPDQQLGARCAVRNSVACDTLTFQLELRRPAASVVASMGTRVVKLLGTPTSEGFPVPDELVRTRPAPRTVFSGELFPIGTARAVAHPRIESGWGNRRGRSHRRNYVDVGLLITYPDGSRVSTVLPVQPMRVYQGGPAPTPLQRMIRAMQAGAVRRLNERSKSQD
jgi:hypothetical protein